MDASIGSELVSDHVISWWARIAFLGTHAGLHFAGYSAASIDVTARYLRAAETLKKEDVLALASRLRSKYVKDSGEPGLEAFRRRTMQNAEEADYGTEEEAEVNVIFATLGRGNSSGVLRLDYSKSMQGVRNKYSFIPLCVNLRSNTKIQELDFSGNWELGTPAGFTLMATALKSNSALRTLNLSSCNIEAEAARCLMEGLKSNKTLAGLDLSRNPLSIEGIKALADFLTTNVSLKSLNLLGAMSYSGSEIYLASALEHNKTLEHLNLGRNSFSSDGMKTLLQPLSGNVGDEASLFSDRKNTTLRSLDLRNINMGHINEPLAYHIASMIRTNTSLSSLGLGELKLSPDDWKGRIFAALKENETLEELDLSDCRGMGEGVYEDLISLLQFSAPRLKRVNLKGSVIQSRQGQVDEEIRLNIQYRRQFRGQAQVQTTSGRLVLCGYEFAGKSAICKTMERLEHGTPCSHALNMGWKKVVKVAPQLRSFLFGRDAHRELTTRTRGFDVLILHKEKYLASVWDFAGQREYYALHDYLFPNTVNSCFLYVSSCRCPPDLQNPEGKVKDQRSMRDECEFWMRFITSNSKPRPGGHGAGPQLPRVRFVLTHKDTLDFDSLNISRQYAEDVVHELRHKFKDVLVICQFVEVVNAHSLEDVQHLVSLTSITLQEILEHQTEYAVCNAVRDVMYSWSARNPSKPVLSLAEFTYICTNQVAPLAPKSFKDAHLDSNEGREAILAYLNDRGEVISPKGLNFIVANPRWFGLGVLGSLIDALGVARDLDQPRVSGCSGGFVRQQRFWKLHHKEGFVERRNIDSLLQHSLHTMNLQQVIPSDMLIQLMIHLELCFEKEPGNVDSSLFIPALFDDQTESAAKGKRQLQWKLQRSEHLCYLGRRLQCENESITFLTPGFFPRLQVHLRNYIHEKNWTKNAGFGVGRNLICFAENGVEVCVEYSGDIDYFVDILVRSSKPYVVALQFVEEHVVMKILQFCASPQGCQGVLLVEAVIRPVCVQGLYLCADRRAHSVLASSLKARIAEDDGYEHTWSHKIEDVRDTDFALDLLEGEGSYMRFLGGRKLNMRVGQIASSSATPSIPHPKTINDSIYVFHDTPNPKVEIIFVHDINWRQYEKPHIQSWMSGSTPSVCWPMDWLSVKYPEARILFARYDAGPWKTDTDGHMRLYLIAENLQLDILSSYTKDSLLVLVGHGLGGLVIKELVRSLQLTRDELERRLHAREHSTDRRDLLKLDSLLRNVRGVLFFAPPFLGSRLVDYTMNDMRGSLLKNMEVMNAHTAELNEWFRKWRQYSGCKATTISAALPTTVELPTQVAVWYGHLTTYIVEEGAARFDSDHFYTSQTDHFSVCKLRDQTDSSFRRLTELIGTII